MQRARPPPTGPRLQGAPTYRTRSNLLPHGVRAAAAALEDPSFAAPKGDDGPGTVTRGAPPCSSQRSTRRGTEAVGWARGGAQRGACKRVPCFVIPQAEPPAPPQRLGWLQAPRAVGRDADPRDPARKPPTCAHGSRGSASTGGCFLPPDLTGSERAPQGRGRARGPLCRLPGELQPCNGREEEKKGGGEGEGRTGAARLGRKGGGGAGRRREDYREEMRMLRRVGMESVGGWGRTQDGEEDQGRGDHIKAQEWDVWVGRSRHKLSPQVYKSAQICPGNSASATCEGPSPAPQELQAPRTEEL